MCQGRPVTAAKSRRERRVPDQRADDRQQHLRQAEAEHQRAHAAQLGQVELEPDHEHQEHDAELGQVLDAGRCRRPARARSARSARRPPGSPASAAASAMRQTTTPSTAATRYSRTSSRVVATLEAAGAGLESRDPRAQPSAPDRPRPLQPSTRSAPCIWPRETFEIEAPRADRSGGAAGRRLRPARCRRCWNAAGRVVVMGMGKSGHVGRKIAATLASTGTPAMFVHPAEASHGDLGMVHGRRRGAGDLATAARATSWPRSCRRSSAWA